MNIEEKYKFIKEKYKEIKEQNDILKKAIVEYKKDIKELEKSNTEQNNKINTIIKENDLLINNNKQLSNKITKLNNSLDEQKKNNAGWGNLRLLRKNSKENECNSVAFEELENKINENEELHKKIEALENNTKRLEKELEIIKNKSEGKFQEKDAIIESLKEQIKQYNFKIKNIENEKNIIVRENESHKKLNKEILEQKNKDVTLLKDTLQKLRRKCYSKYEINFKRIPFYGTFDHHNYTIQNEIYKNVNNFKNLIVGLIEQSIMYLSLSEELFTINENQLLKTNEKIKKKESNAEDAIEYSKIEHLIEISKEQIGSFEKVIQLLQEFKNICVTKKDPTSMKNVLQKVVEEIKKLFNYLIIYLCIEGFYFPTQVINKHLRLKNVIREFRNMKNIMVRMISILNFTLFSTPYNNKQIVANYFEKTRIKKIQVENNPDRFIYYNNANYEEDINEISTSDEEEPESEQTERIDQMNACQLINEKEKKTLSKFQNFYNYAEQNNKIVLFLTNKFKKVIEELSYTFEFLRTYISFRMCDRKEYASINIYNSKKISTLLDLTNTFITAIENFDIEYLNTMLTSFLSYYRFNNSFLIKEQQNYLKNINQTLNQSSHVSYNSLQNSLKELQFYKKSYRNLNESLEKKNNTIKKLKKINKQALEEYKHTLEENKSLNLHNEILSNETKDSKETNSIDDISNIELYAEKVLQYIISNKSEQKNLNIKEKQILEAYVTSCVKIHQLQLEIENNKKILEEFKKECNIKENENKNLNDQIQTQKEEEFSIHKKYEEQMKALHDLIVSLEKQITRLNSEKGVNKLLIVCSECGNKNNIGLITKNRKCTKCNSIILLSK